MGSHPPTEVKRPAAPVSSVQGQKNMAVRGARIAVLRAMNDRLRKLAPGDAWADSNIDQAEDLDALQDQISEALTKAERGKQPTSALRSELEQMSGHELRVIFERMNLAGTRMTHSERVDALMAEDEADVRAAMVAQSGAPSLRDQLASMDAAELDALLPPDPPAKPANPDALPGGVKSVIGLAVGQLNEVRAQLDGVERARGRGHILALEWRDQAEKIAKARAKLAEIRGLAQANGNAANLEAYIAQIGGEPELDSFNVTPVTGTQVYGSARAGSGVTPQVASSRQLQSMIEIAADSVAALRQSDVDRVLREAPAHFRDDLARHIRTARPDLSGEVADVMAEIDAPTPQQGRAPQPPADGLNLSDAGRAALDEFTRLLGQGPEVREDAPAYGPQFIDVDGVRRPATDSTGKRIHPTEEGIRNFWRWFGDSKVVDEQGRPLVVYHGTTEADLRVASGIAFIEPTFEVFDVSVGIEPGAWFSPDKTIARRYGHVTEHYLRAERPIRDEAPISAPPTDGDAVYRMRGKGDQIRDAFEFAVFRPNQVKSATGNNGDFSPRDASILREDAPSYQPDGVDPAIYRKAKPLMDALLADADAQGQSAPDFIRALVAKFGDNAVAKAMIRAYVRDPNKGKSDAPGGNTDLAGNRPDAIDGDGEVGAPVPDGNRGPGRGSRGGGRGGSRSGSRGVRGDRAAAAGERSNQPLDSGERPAGPAPGTAGGDVDPRGGGLGDSGVPVEPAGAAATAQRPEGGVPESVKREQQRAAPTNVSRGDLQNIRDTLPLLLPGQQEDVHKAEQRFAKPDGYGMLFTNGTGTGKTFTGLGVVKRFALEGKTNTVIVAPNDKIIEDWIKSGERLGLSLSKLDDTKTAGSGIVVTTFANFGQNDALAARDWDLVVIDEAHYLSQEKGGAETQALSALRAITLHPRGAMDRADMLHRPLVNRVAEIQQTLKRTKASQDMMDEDYARVRDLEARLNAELKEKSEQLRAARAAVRADVEARQGAPRTRGVFLSATPFAYEFSIDWAEGFLFDYGKEPDGRGYNTPDARGAFFMQHFGYRMRYGKLTAPDARVDSGLMQRQFNAWLKTSGSLSNRALDVAPDHDRKFQLVESAIGRRIDEALEWLHDQAYKASAEDRGMSALRGAIASTFDYHSRQYLLEAIKANEAIPHIRAHLALGRKVVVYHDFKKGGGFNPFKRAVEAMLAAGQVTIDRSVEGLDDLAEHAGLATREELLSAATRFRDQFPDLIDATIGQLPSPIQAISAAFPNVLLFNGDIAPKQRRANVAKFNADESGPQVILVQSAAGKEGISLHDTTGKHQRALLNLGMPTAPVTAIQIEGRIYRTGQMTDAILRYFNTGTRWEQWAFATTIATRASTAENLGAGEAARALKDAFIAGFEESGDFPAGHEGEGKGGKDRDRLANSALTEWDRAKAFYFGTEKKTGRTKAAEGEDYFATPEPVGLKMVQFLDLRPGEHALEPSAGHGAIARWLPDNTVRTAIEPSGKLRPRLAMVFNGKIVDSTFEDLHVVNKYDGIAMNPPFGTAGRTAIDHLAKAATHLNDGGRIVALIPTGPAADAKFDKWFYEEREPSRPLMQHPVHGPIFKGDTIVTRMTRGVVTRLLGDGRGANAMIEAQEAGYPSPTAHLIAAIDAVEPGPRESKHLVADGLHLVADIKLPGVTFERAGTKVMTRIVVIEKPMKGTDAPQQTNRDFSGIEKIDELFDRLQDLDLKPRAKSRDAAQAEQQQRDARTDRARRDDSKGPVTAEELRALQDTARGQALDEVRGALRFFEDGDLEGAAALVRRAENVTGDTSFLEAAAGVADRLLDQAEAGKPKAATKVSAAQFRHTKTGETIYVGKMDGRVSNDEYRRIAGLARSGGGYWSKFARDGAIPGFHFKTALERDTFIAAVRGEDPPQGNVREDQATYGAAVPVSATDGGNMVSDRGRRSSAGASEVPASLDLFTASGAPAFAARKFAADLKARNIPVATGTYRTGITQIDSWLDAAHVVAPLRKSPQEQMIVVVADSRGKLLAVLRHSIGGRDSAGVEVGTVFGAIAQIPGARTAWLAHNHPSGDPTQSGADKILTNKFAELAEGTGIKIPGMIVVAPGSRSASFLPIEVSYGRDGIGLETFGTVPAANRTESADVLERATRRVPGRRVQVDMPDVALKVVKDAGLTSGLVLLDGRHGYVGNVPMSLDDMAKLRTGSASSGAAALASILTEANASAVIVVTPESNRDRDIVHNIARFVRLGGWRVLDHIGGGVSLGDPAPDFTSFQSRSGDAAPGVRGMPEDGVRAISDEFMAQYRGAQDVRVYVVGDLSGVDESLGSNARAAFHPASQSVFLAANRLSGRRDVEDALRHELAHFGLDLLPAEDKADLLRRIADARESSPAIRQVWEEVDRLYADHDESGRAEEVFTHVAQNDRGQFGRAWDAILSKLAAVLRKIGLVRGALTMPELRTIAARMAAEMKSGAKRAADYARAAGMRASRSDLFGDAPSDQQQAIAKARERIEAKLRGDGRGYVAPSEGPGDLFGGPRQEQSEMFGPSRDLLGNPIRPAADDGGGQQSGFKFSRMPPHWTPEQRAAAAKTRTFAQAAPLSQRWQQMRQGLGERLTQRIFDQFASLRRLDPEAFMQAHLSKGTDGTLEMVFTEGPPRWHQGAFTVDAGQGGLQGVLSKLDGEHDQFLLWIAGNRAERLAIEGRENLFDQQDIAALKDMNRGTMADGRSRALAYAQAHAEFKRYMKAHLDIAEAAGLIDPASRHLWEHDFYVPFYRVMEDDDSVGPGQIGGLLRQRAFHKLKGGQEELGDLLANTLANWSHLLTASMKNSAAQKTMDALVASGGAVQIQAPQKGSVWVMRGGQQEHYLVADPLALEAMQALNFAGIRNGVMDAATTMKRVLTMGVTISPSFRIRNTMRDTLSALATADVGWNPIANMVNGWQAMAPGGAERANLIAGGGAIRFGSFNDGAQAAHAKRMISMGIKNNQILDTPEKIKNAIRRLWDGWQDIGDRAESINRSVVYRNAIAAGKSHLEASFEARDLMNFTSMGSSTAIRAAAQLLPFFNARLQGTYRLVRGAKRDPRRFTAVVGMLGMASALLYLLQRDDEEYQALPDYVRDGHWPIKLFGTWFYIPKPFEVGAMATVIERGTELALAGDDYQAKDFANTVLSVLGNQLAMNPVPQAIKPAAEAIFNYDMFRDRPIDSPWEVGSEADRFDASTSAGAVAAGAALDASPRKIEHLVRGYFGWLGAQVLNVSDLLLRDAMDLPSNPRRDLTSPSNMFVVGDFVKDAGDVSSKYVARFYEMQEDINRIYADVKRARQDGDDARLEELQDDPRYSLRSRYNSAGQRLSAINRKIREIGRDPEMTATEKNREIRELNRERAEIAREVDREARAGG